MRTPQPVIKKKSQQEVQDKVAASISTLEKDVSTLDTADLPLNLQEPQRSSTPKFDEELNVTILDGNIQSSKGSEDKTPACRHS